MTSIKTVLASLCVVAAFSTALSPAKADPITYAGTFSIADTSPANNNVLTVVSIPGGFSLPLSYGQQIQNVTLASFFKFDTTQTYASLATETIQGTFVFTAPVSETNTVNGSVTKATAELFGHFSSNGALVWNTNDLTVGFSDGSALDIGLSPSYFAKLNGTSDAQVVSANFTLIKESVPKPVSIATLGVGLLGLGAIARRLRATTAAA